MAFKAKAFEKAKFEPRSESVPVSALAEWFDGPAEWVIRGLTGNELGRCNALAQKNRKTIAEIVSGLLSSTDGSVSETVRNLVGLSDDVPQETAQRIEYLQIGSQDPACDLELAIKLNETFPVEFLLITNRIIALTGKGHVPGKSKPSGKMTASEPA